MATTARESLLQHRLDGKVRCDVCERRCVLVPGGQGWCQTRVNRDGVLTTLVYGAVSSLAVDPIEKKPLYHFHPGTTTLTAGGWSCNFGCPWCQNWSISRVPPPTALRYVSPSHFVGLAEQLACGGVSLSYNEPTLALEWALDVFRLARARGLTAALVSNGYMTPAALALLIEAGLDAMNIDIKGGAAAVWQYSKGVDVEKVWAACGQVRAHAVHLEITTLVIPGVNDDDATLCSIASRIAGELGTDVPWHVSGYYPAYRFTTRPTPGYSLERAWHTGHQAGLDFVYVDNLPGHDHHHTYCPGCGTRLITRDGFTVQSNILHDGWCPDCGLTIPGQWSMVNRQSSTRKELIIDN